MNGQYILAGEHDRGGGAKNDQPVKVLHLRLSAETLARVLEHGGQTNIGNVDGTEPTLTVNDVSYPLQRSNEAAPHHLHSLTASGPSSPRRLEHIGQIRTKLAVRPNSIPSSSVTSKLKERREMEEARKSEHRAVLLDAAPVMTKGRTSSTLKLRPKGLAPSANNSPLLRSRAATPVEVSSLSSSPSAVANSPKATITANGGTSQIKSSPLKRDSSPTGLRRQLIQLLAKGPQSRLKIVQEVQFAEPQILSMLPRIASTPDDLQPTASDVSSHRINGGPVNRSGHSGPRHSTSASLAHSTIYVLKDEIYREVLIKDWEAYSSEEKVQVSELTEGALDRTGVSKEAPERQQIVRALPNKTRQHLQDRLDDGSELSEEDMTTADASTSQNDKGSSKTNISKKPTTKERLAKAAKGKMSSTRATAVKSATKPAANAPVADASASAKESVRNEPRVASTGSTKAKIVKSHALSRTSSGGTGKASVRRDIEYTDSSDDEEEDRKRHPASTTSTAHGKSDSSSAAVSASVQAEARGRQGVGRGASLTKEPWLEVGTARDWHELAKRFRRVYGEYQSGLARVREEEELLRRELKQALMETAEYEGKGRTAVYTRTTRNSGTGGDTDRLNANEEREEGEASPTIDQGASTFGEAFGWRDSAEVKNNTADGQKKRLPMPLEEMDPLVTSVLEMEGQLKRMKSALQASKERLEEG